MAEREVAEEEARQKAQEAAQRADGGIRVAEESAQRDGRVGARRARAGAFARRSGGARRGGRERMLIEADAERERRSIAHGEAEAILRACGRGRGPAADPGSQGQGLWPAGRCLQRALPQSAASLLIIEKLVEVAGVQAQAIQTCLSERWSFGTAARARRPHRTWVSALWAFCRPCTSWPRWPGLDLPEYLGAMAKEAEADESADPSASEDA